VCEHVRYKGEEKKNGVFRGHGNTKEKERVKEKKKRLSGRHNQNKKRRSLVRTKRRGGVWCKKRSPAAAAASCRKAQEGKEVMRGLKKKRSIAAKEHRVSKRLVGKKRNTPLGQRKGEKKRGGRGSTRLEGEKSPSTQEHPEKERAPPFPSKGGKKGNVIFATKTIHPILGKNQAVQPREKEKGGASQNVDVNSGGGSSSRVEERGGGITRGPLGPRAIEPLHFG